MTLRATSDALVGLSMLCVNEVALAYSAFSGARPTFESAREEVALSRHLAGLFRRDSAHLEVSVDLLAHRCYPFRTRCQHEVVVIRGDNDSLYPMCCVRLLSFAGFHGDL